jgi:hypothetical protein
LTPCFPTTNACAPALRTVPSSSFWWSLRSHRIPAISRGCAAQPAAHCTWLAPLVFASTNMQCAELGSTTGIWSRCIIIGRCLTVKRRLRPRAIGAIPGVEAGSSPGGPSGACTMRKSCLATRWYSAKKASDSGRKSSNRAQTVWSRSRHSARYGRSILPMPSRLPSTKHYGEMGCSRLLEVSPRSSAGFRSVDPRRPTCAAAPGSGRVGRDALAVHTRRDHALTEHCSWGRTRRAIAAGHRVEVVLCTLGHVRR